MHKLMDEEVRSAAERGMRVDVQKYVKGIKEMTEDSPNMNMNEAVHIDPSTGKLEEESELSYHYKITLADAKGLTKLRGEFTYIKNYFENKIMQLYVRAEVDIQELEILI